MEFKFDKEKFGDLATEVENIADQAIKYGRKTLGDEKDTKINTLEEQLKALQSEKNSLVFEKELSSVKENNKKLIIDLAQNQPENIAAVKENYPNLFESQLEVKSISEAMQSEIIESNKQKESSTFETLKNKDKISEEELNEALENLRKEL